MIVLIRSGNFRQVFGMGENQFETSSSRIVASKQNALAAIGSDTLRG